jgi:glyoxylase-like metal-dependent hydrolase (beta-lactamase superfamily II)
MISIETFGKVKKFRMARSIFGRAVYFTAAYWVDGLMVDTGCSYTVNELVAAVARLDLDFVVNTHSHEDHIGANAALSINRGAGIFAHPEALPILAVMPSSAAGTELLERITTSGRSSPL